MDEIFMPDPSRVPEGQSALFGAVLQDWSRESELEQGVRTVAGHQNWSGAEQGVGTGAVPQNWCKVVGGGKAESHATAKLPTSEEREKKCLEVN